MVYIETLVNMGFLFPDACSVLWTERSAGVRYVFGSPRGVGKT